MGLIFRRRPRGYDDDPNPGRDPRQRQGYPPQQQGRGDRLPPELDPNRPTAPGRRAPSSQRSRGGFFAGKGRLFIALAIAAIPMMTFLKNCSVNPYTGRRQSVSMTPDQEIQLGLQAAPKMIQQHRGHLRDAAASRLVQRVGQRLVERSDAKNSPYEFQFHALEDRQVVNAFALPGGQVFITGALLGRLKTEGEIAGVLGHEIGHVLGRHGAERMEKMKLTQGLTGAVLVATYDPRNPSAQKKAAMTMMVGQLLNMKWGRNQELESDRLGVRYMIQSGYHPESLIRVMQVLAEAAGGKKPPEFMSTHPSPDNRIEKIRQAIEEVKQELGGSLPPNLVR